MSHFEQAIERVIAGLEVKNPVILYKERVISYHEAAMLSLEKY